MTFISSNRLALLNIVREMPYRVLLYGLGVPPSPRPCTPPVGVKYMYLLTYFQCSHLT